MKKSLVLIADDDDAIRTVVEKKLQRSGFDTRSTNNGKELYHWIEKGDGDLIITDVVMPEFNGLELLPLMIWISCLLICILNLETIFMFE